MALISLQNETYSVYLDTGCGMSLIDRKFLLKMLPTASIHTLKTDIKVRSQDSQRHDANQFVDLGFYLLTTNGIMAQFSPRGTSRQ